jgi:hypothetical protein
MHKEGEIQQLEIWTSKSIVRIPILYNSKRPETYREYFWNILKLLEGITTRGEPWWATTHQAAPGGPGMP